MVFRLPRPYMRPTLGGGYEVFEPSSISKLRNILGTHQIVLMHRPFGYDMEVTYESGITRIFKVELLFIHFKS